MLSMSPASSITLEHENSGKAEREPGSADPVTSLKSADPFQVSLDLGEDPQNSSRLTKWVVVLVLSSASLCATCASSMVRWLRSTRIVHTSSCSFQSIHQALFAEDGTAQEFNISHTATILSISLFSLGLGVGHLLVGPVSEVSGRNLVYRMSFGLFFVFSWPITFAPNARKASAHSIMMILILLQPSFSSADSSPVSVVQRSSASQEEALPTYFPTQQ